MNYSHLDGDNNHCYSFTNSWSSRNNKHFMLKLIIKLITACAVLFLLTLFLRVGYEFVNDSHQGDIEELLPLPELHDEFVISETGITKTEALPIENVVTEVSEPTPEIELVVEEEEEAEKELWQEHVVKPGETLSAIFSQHKIKQADLIALVKLPEGKQLFARLKPKQVLLFQVDDEHHLSALKIKKSAIETTIITRNDNKFEIYNEKIPLEKRTVRIVATVDHSLAEAAKFYHIPNKVMMELAQVFSWQINFKRDIQKGDQFTLLYQNSYADNKLVGVDGILAAEIINHGRAYQAVRYEDSNGLKSYYTPEGDSLEHAFLRSPVKYKRISSPFNPNRMHPILKQKRPHYGVDLAAPTNTPIRATGDGRISFVGRRGGYGNVITIAHTNLITTVYAHMNKFAKGSYKGKRVRKGDIIGYVGSTGLASGPHLHYEYRIKNKPVNPLKVALPKGKPLPKEQLPEFFKVARGLMAELKDTAATHFVESKTSNEAT